MGDQQNDERIPKENEVEELVEEEEEEGESLSMRFLALAVSHTVPSSNRQRHSEVGHRPHSDIIQLFSSPFPPSADKTEVEKS